jgi:hypothetical protein
MIIFKLEYLIQVFLTEWEYPYQIPGLNLLKLLRFTLCLNSIHG